MEKKDRIKKLINWLVFSGVVEGQNDLAARLGYSKSYMSQVCNAAKVINDSFVSKLCSLDENLSLEWAMTGVGDMFVNNPFSVSGSVEESSPPSGSGGCVSVDADAWAVIKNQAQSLASRDRQVDELISLLRSSLDEVKKMAAQEDGRAGCADAV